MIISKNKPKEKKDPIHFELNWFVNIQVKLFKNARLVILINSQTISLEKHPISNIFWFLIIDKKGIFFFFF